MTYQVTLNVTGKNVKGQNDKTQQYTIMTENKSFINSIVTVKNENNITFDDLQKLRETAQISGDGNILEYCDLNPQHKLNLANLSGFSEYYDIKLSDDCKYFQVTVKDAGCFTKNPTLGTIKSDFGVKDGVFVKSGEIPHGNENLINQRAKAGSSADGRNTDYDETKLEPGDTINVPVEEININGSPRGFWGRFFQ